MSLDVTAAIDAIGFGRFQWYLLAYTGLAWFADACETMLLSFLSLAVKCEWDLTPNQAALLSSVVFVGMMAGVYSLGALSDLLGRRRGFFASAALLGGAGLGSAFVPSYRPLLALRGVVGFALGGTPIAVTLFAEFLPTQGRGGWLLALQAFWTLGTLGMSGMAWATVSTPDWGWRWMLGLGAAPMFLLLTLYPLLPESPHWLVTRAREAAARGATDQAERDQAAALAVLRRVARVNGRWRDGSLARRGSRGGVAGPDAIRDHAGNDATGDELAALLSSEASHSSAATPRSGADKTAVPRKRSVLASLRALYAPEFARTTLLLDVIWFVNAITYYGLVLLTTELQTTDKIEHCTSARQPNLGSRDFTDVMITSMAEVPGLLVAAVLVDGRGRKWSLRAGMALTGAAILGLLGVPRKGWAQLGLLFLSRAGIMGAYSVLYVYTPEIYPTQLRSFGLALCNMLSRVGGFMAPFATTALVESGQLSTTLLLLGGFCLVACGASFMLQHETRGRDLQTLHLEDTWEISDRRASNLSAELTCPGLSQESM